MNKLKQYKLSFEYYCIFQEKMNKYDNNLIFICNDCGHCYNSFYDMLEVAIVMEKYNDEIYKYYYEILREED